jgi:salicylate hydroxylase
MAEAREILGDLTDTAKIYLGEKRLVVTYRVSGGSVSPSYRFSIFFYLFQSIYGKASTDFRLIQEFNFLHTVYEPDKPWPSPDAVTEKVTHEEMCADFDGHGIDSRLLRLLEKAHPVRWGLFHHLHTSTYFRGRAVLIGDSAHASLPYQAAGAGQGVEDALILSTVLGAIDRSKTATTHSSAQLEAALCAYDAVRRPRAQHQAEQSLDASQLLSFQHPQAGSDMDKILPRMQDGRFDWLWFHDLRDDVHLSLEKMKKFMQRD